MVVHSYSKSIAEIEPKTGINCYISKDTLKGGRFECCMFKCTLDLAIVKALIHEDNQQNNYKAYVLGKMKQSWHNPCSGLGELLRL